MRYITQDKEDVLDVLLHVFYKYGHFSVLILLHSIEYAH